MHRAAAVYLASAWLIIQIVETLTPDILPAVVFRVTVIIAAIGFVPALVLSWIFEWTPDGLKREHLLDSEPREQDTRRLDRGIMLILVLAVAYFAVDKFIFDPARDEAQIEAATAEAVEDALAGKLQQKYANRSILVLPFLNISADANQEYFADGIAEELLNLLARIDELRVISRSTSWTFKGKDVDVAGIKDQLDVSHILEGSVRKSGNQIRITAQLIDTATDRHLWSETYDRTLDDVFAIQDEIAAMVVEQVKVNLLAGPPVAESIDSVAYDLYLQGRYIMHTLDRTSANAAQELEQAATLFTNSLEISPDYVPAIFELARALGSLSQRANKLEDKTALQARFRSQIDRLVELAPDSGFTNGFLSFFAEQEGNIQAAALYRERAIAATTDWYLYVQLRITARFLYDLGRVDEAEMLVRYLVDRDPAASGNILLLGGIFRWNDRHHELAELLEELLEWWDGTPLIYWYLGVALLVEGEPDKAMPYFERASPYNRAIGRMLALHDLGRHEEFEAELATMLADPDQHPEAIARVAAWTGRHDLAFEYLELTVAVDGPGIVGPIKKETDLYGPIMSDPRWQDFLDLDDTTVERDYSNIRFNPKLPAEVVEALAEEGH